MVRSSGDGRPRSLRAGAVTAASLTSVARNETRTVFRLWIGAMERSLAVGALDPAAMPLETAKLFVHGDSLSPITDAERTEARRLADAGFIEVRPHPSDASLVLLVYHRNAEPA